MKRVVILSSQEGDWEVLYIDGKSVEQGHTLGEGDSQLFLLRKAKEFDFTIDDVFTDTVNDEDEEYLPSGGWFPEELSSLKGEYAK